MTHRRTVCVAKLDDFFAWKFQRAKSGYTGRLTFRSTDRSAVANWHHATGR
jgi:hypothetical protein